jgi:hypothetical protein
MRYRTETLVELHRDMTNTENSVPFGGGEMGALIRRRDWSDSGLGPTSE